MLCRCKFFPPQAADYPYNSGMLILLFVSFVWAFSFGLIKGELVNLPPELVAFLRLLISMLVFLPLVRLRGLGWRMFVRLMAVGAVQYGLMYVAYISAYGYLQAYQVAMMTITTPLYVAIIAGLYERRLRRRAMVAVAGAIAGAFVIVYRSITPGDFGLGMLLMQAANICFAWGQVYYRRLGRANPAMKASQVFAVIYLGAVITAAAATVSAGGFADIVSITAGQWLVLLYLGVLASGVCFFLWNYAALRVKVSSLAAANNLKIPLAVCCSLIFFGESANLPRLIIGAVIIAAAFIWSGGRDQGQA